MSFSRGGGEKILIQNIPPPWFNKQPEIHEIWPLSLKAWTVNLSIFNLPAIADHGVSGLGYFGKKPTVLITRF